MENRTPKRFLTLALFFMAMFAKAQGQSSELSWHTNLEDAERISQKTNKPILLYFTGSDWCSPCKMLKKDFFDSPEFAARADKMVLMMIDYPRRIDILTQEQLAYNKTLLEKYNPKKVFPMLLFLNHKGKVKGKMEGYSPLRDTHAHFEFIDRHTN